ncbi:sensor histidine kinase [Tellurirhabdus rosea]|uniref:sensor histidine kinase n=1 Tax=Tellurirhabdus rosea TaxID=2674997 RepID=UPI002251474D|nr:sensor histidine kinase [Tellurirhabdus rosea]
MRSLNYSRYDWVLQLLILPVYIGLLNWILIGETYWQNRSTLLMATGITFVTSFANWLVNNQVAAFVNRKFGDPNIFLLRSMIRFVCTSSVSTSFACLLFGLYTILELPGFVADGARLAFGILYTLGIVAVVIITYEGMDTYRYWMQSRREVDTLSKAQLQAQFDALRQQVNPHFLFNSLNSLISLIDENPRQAGIYAEELSSVYRYLLRSNEAPLVPLSTELDFVTSYYHLLKTRHGDAIQLVTRILPGMEERQLPPLTLQLLIENAVKHNVVLPEQPLTILLATDGPQLVVSNNLQRKPSRTLSNGVGLSNILTKYQMLGQPAPVIEDNGREFRVRLPLVDSTKAPDSPNVPAKTR